YFERRRAIGNRVEKVVGNGDLVTVLGHAVSAGGPGAGRDHRAAILRHANISNIGQVGFGDNTRAKAETTGKFNIVKLGDIELVGDCIHLIDHHVPSAPEDRARLGADRAAYQRQQRQGKHGNNGKLTPHLASSSETRVARLFRSTSV